MSPIYPSIKKNDGTTFSKDDMAMNHAPYLVTVFVVCHRRNRVDPETLIYRVSISTTQLDRESSRKYAKAVSATMHERHNVTKVGVVISAIPLAAIDVMMHEPFAETAADEAASAPAPVRFDPTRFLELVQERSRNLSDEQSVVVITDDEDEVG